MKMKKWIIPIVGVIIVILLIVFILFLVNKKEKNNIPSDNQNQIQKEEDQMEEEYLTGKHQVTIEVQNYGTIEVEIDADIAPITATNFIKLAKEGFYDGLTFHRIMEGFMIQGGDPLGNGMGGSSQKIKGEFELNGVENNLSHTRGVISMARSNSYNSASSQFFIMHQDNTYLDGKYAAFGKVTSGMEVVDKICEEVPVLDNNGSVAKENQPVITKVTVK